MNATTIYTAEYERFFREHAQFFPPCDEAWYGCEPFKLFGSYVFAHLQDSEDFRVEGLKKKAEYEKIMEDHRRKSLAE